jgi:small-conductance mechanosensitive channel
MRNRAAIESDLDTLHRVEAENAQIDVWNNQVAAANALLPDTEPGLAKMNDVNAAIDAENAEIDADNAELRGDLERELAELAPVTDPPAKSEPEPTVTPTPEPVDRGGLGVDAVEPSEPADPEAARLAAEAEQARHDAQEAEQNAPPDPHAVCANCGTPIAKHDDDSPASCNVPRSVIAG